MIAFPAVAALVALVCALFVSADAWRRPRPERFVWAVAFLVFGLAAASEVAGSLAGWTPMLARVYYLAGAVLVVGLLALGELYLLFQDRMPSVTPGVALLICALAATAVWSAPLDFVRLETQGWEAIERGPLLIALAVSINAGGTIVLVLGAVYSAWKLKERAGSQRRTLGCILIAAGTLVVAAGGTFTRLGHREYLYLAMAIGISIIFTGVILTRSRHASSGSIRAEIEQLPSIIRFGPVPLAIPRTLASSSCGADVGLAYITAKLLTQDDASIAAACARWSATAWTEPVLSRDRAHLVWALRVALPDAARDQFDRLPLATQAQIAELYAEVWSPPATPIRDDRPA